jgi:hypothetical protein
VAERVVIDRRYRGLERVAQGGYSSGLLAGFLDGPARVKLRAPVPMERPLRVEVVPGGVELHGDAGVLAAASATELDLEPPERVTVAEAERASGSYPGHRHHPFPGCFCCGPDRAAGDGLRIFPGPLPGRDAVAAPWTPAADFADERGFVRPEVVWAAFDCPQLWALIVSAPRDSSDHVVTAALETELRGPVQTGARHSVLAWPIGGEGRRLSAGAALLTEAGEAVAVSRQTAVIAEAGVPLGLSSFSG